jgi:hypothetical protein
MLSIAHTLREQSEGLKARGVLVHAAYGVATCFLSAVQTAQGTGVRAGGGGAGEGLGAEDPSAALICDENVTLTLARYDVM